MSANQDGFTTYASLLLSVVTLLFLVTGCGGGGGGGSGGGNSGPADNTVPTVTSMSPAEDTFVVGTNSRLTATLSEAMIPTAINPANFRVTDGGNYVAGTVTYDATNHIAIFRPTTEFLPNTRYTATIITGIKDLSGNPLTTDFAWCFTTTGGRDSTAPNVISSIPANNATAVATTRKISATFNEDINSLSLTSATFIVTGPGSTPVAGSVTYFDRTAVFTPNSPLASNTTYTATLTTGVTDLADNTLQTDASWTFTTSASADTTAPTVAATSPANAQSAVAIDSAINITFNEPMDPTSFNTENFFVTGPGGGLVIGTVAYDASTNTAIFTRINHQTSPVTFHPTPITNLAPSTSYTATLTTGAKDMAGNTLASNRVWTFTTGP